MNAADKLSHLLALTRDGLVPRSFTFEGHLEQLADRVARRSLAGLARGIDWLVQQCPRLDGRRVVWAMDFPGDFAGGNGIARLPSVDT